MFLTLFRLGGGVNLPPVKHSQISKKLSQIELRTFCEDFSLLDNVNLYYNFECTNFCETFHQISSFVYVIYFLPVLIFPSCAG